MKGRNKRPPVPVSIAEEWEVFSRQCFEADTSALDKAEARACFYAGARATLFNVMNAARLTDGSVIQSLFARWNAELEDYAADVARTGELPK